MEYIRFTKAQKDSIGHNVISCKFKGTEQCPIHSCGNCGNCDVFNGMLEQLYQFENVLEECIGSEVRENTTN